MTDRQKNINNTIFKEAVKKLPLKFPIAEISKKTSFSKGVVSNIINDKIPVSDNFLKIFAEAYGIDLKNDFDYAKVREHNESVLKENEAKRLAKLKYVGKGGGNRIYGPDKEVMMVSEPTATYGEDLVNKTNYKSKKSELIPYYDVDFIAGNSFETVESTKTFPDYMMDIPEFSGCVAFRAYSDSMNNLIKSGNILFATKVESWLEHLEFGQIYGVVCTDGRKYLKYIKKFKENSQEYFLLESENKHYDEFEMPKKSIRSIWLIHGWLNKSV